MTLNKISPNLNILVVAGPTRELIDPVRFITNYSTGTMGYAVANTARNAGHKVTLITGPTHLKHPREMKTITVITAQEMFKAVKACFKTADCVIMAAAVSDFRPEKYCVNKIKRSGSMRVLRLKKNPDILSWLGRRKGDRLLIGFCMETSNLMDNARKKMRLKKADLIVANRIDTRPACLITGRRDSFGPGTTTVFILGPEQQSMELKNVSKQKVSRILLEKIEHLWYKNQ
jgi:phosphopantothenoylcysteine decarboxylase/phosphopantothenate--cysteine ligase